jgi:regulator of nucleoside diphosphate kinase
MQHYHPTIVSTQDYYRLQALMCSTIGLRTPIVQLVRHKLRSAVVMLPSDISPDVVTAGRRVQFTIDSHRSDVRALTWETPAPGVRSKLSLFAPRGLALLGLTAGQSVSYTTATRGTEVIEIHVVSADDTTAAEPQLLREATVVLDRAALRAAAPSGCSQPF